MSTQHRLRLALALAAAVSLAHATTTRADAETAVDPTPSTLAETPWYTGGSLHKASAREWLDATVKNQLATASDWVLTSKSVKAKFATSGDMGVVRPHADQLRQCVNAALRRHSDLYAKMPVADIAVTCLITLNL
jgi:hypothetical protein